ncbi:MAG: HAD-IIIC family phosphatase [Acidobacteriota bacterium]|nr:HAD-IIIC family phosphatase [Acidobacteriota bacterium]
MKPRRIQVLADFLALEMRDPLELLFGRLGISLDLRFAQYGPVVHQLFEVNSTILETDMVVILLRLRRLNIEDSVRNTSTQTNVQILSLALHNTFCTIEAPELLVISCPDPNATYNSEIVENELRVELQTIPRAKFWSAADQLQKYPSYDPRTFASDFRQEDMLYSPLYFAILGSIVARTAHALWSRPKKVIAVDCDNTLWVGACGELGPLGVHVDENCIALQRALLQQHKGGKLICLCSKNNTQEVMRVFAENPNMILQLEHITKSIINWDPKHKNIELLSLTTKLKLDSFIFIDDDAFECEAMRSALPEVCTVQMPCAAEGWGPFLEGLWDFDVSSSTHTDSVRASYYRDSLDAKRAEFAIKSPSEFVADLALVVTFSFLDEKDLRRAAQITQRVNQFNLTGNRFSERDLWKETYKNSCETICAADRFGDYGLVGVLLYKDNSSDLCVGELFLSCRVLGRGIEERLNDHIRAIADRRGIERVIFSYVPTDNNEPVRRFLVTYWGEVKHPDNEFAYRISADKTTPSRTLQPSPHEAESNEQQSDNAR